MKIFDYLRTTFNLIKAFLTQDVLVIVGLAVLALMIVWSVLSLVFSYEKKAERNFDKIMSFLKYNKITKTTYPKLCEEIKRLPLSACRNWKKYESTLSGKPSDYLTKWDCLDDSVSGGIHKQNRSLMKFAIWMVTILLFAFSVATIDIEGVALTASMFGESLITPVVMLLLYYINYYVYTSIRHNTYRSACDAYQDFADAIDERIDLADIFDKNESSLAMISTIYENESMKMIVPKVDKNRVVEELVKRDETKPVKPTNKTIVQIKSDQVPVEKKRNVKVAKESNKMVLKTNRVDMVVSNENEITSMEQFIKTLDEVEKLLAKDSKTETQAQTDARTKKVNELMEALNKYRNNKIN